MMIDALNTRNVVGRVRTRARLITVILYARDSTVKEVLNLSCEIKHSAKDEAYRSLLPRHVFSLLMNLRRG